MKHEDIYYYSDLINDDFASAQINSKPLPDNFRYFHKNPFYHLAANFIYFCIAKPYIFIYRKLVWHHTFINRKSLNIKGGYFLYGNHTQSTADAFIPNGLKFHKRNYIIVNNDAFAIPFIKTIVSMLGGIPLSDKIAHKKEFFLFVKDAVENNKSVTIYPEAHIWPYYTKIRPFESTSFKYPSKFNKPVFAFTNCYQKRIIGKKPKIKTFIDGPFYPDMSLPLNERTEKLRDEIFKAMTKRSSENSNYEFVKYIKVETENDIFEG